MYLPGILAATALLMLCTVVPFLPGGYDGLAVPLSAMAQMVGTAGLAIVPFCCAVAGRRACAVAGLLAIRLCRPDPRHHRSRLGPHLDRRRDPERCRAGIRDAGVGRARGSEDPDCPHRAKRALARKDARPPDLSGLRADCGGTAAAGRRRSSSAVTMKCTTCRLPKSDRRLRL
jgi:hypothetical protein